MGKITQYLLVVFFIIVVSVPTYWLTKDNTSEQISIVEGRELAGLGKTYPTLNTALEYIRQGRFDLAANLLLKLFSGKSLQLKFDNAAIDQFPLRIPLIMFSKTIDQHIIKFCYQFTNDRVIPADMSSELYIMLDHQALIPAPLQIEADSFSIIDDRIRNYNEIVSTYPEINVSIFYIESIRSSPYHPLAKYFSKADIGQAFEYFKNNLPQQISLGSMRVSSIEDHLQYFYRTDHHWNTAGILRGYQKIHEILSNNYANISKTIKPSAMVPFPDIEFLGTYARRSLYPTRGDAFMGFEADFPECTVSDQGIEGDYDHRDEYLRGEYLTTPYISHYGLYFGSVSGLIEYNCDNNATRNILVIGDSYSRPLIPLIANHYQHTYYMDLRQHDDFKLSEFLSKYSIDDLLLVGGANILFFENDQWVIEP